MGFLLTSGVLGPYSANSLSLPQAFAENPDNISDIGTYVIYGLEDVDIDNNVTIQSGNIGIHDDSKKKGEFKLKKEINFEDEASIIVANKIKIEKEAIAPNVFYNELDNKGDILGDENTPLDLPVVNNLPEFPEFEAGDEDIEVGKNKSITIESGNYGKIELKKGAIMIFEGGEYNIESIKADKDSQILFEDSSEIRVKKDVKLDKMVTIGPHPESEIEASDIVFFVGGDKSKSKIEFGKNSVIYANFYSLIGEIKMKKQTHAVGSFIAEKIKIEKDVNLTLDSFSDIPIEELVGEYIALIEKLDGVGNNIGEITVTPEFIQSVEDDLDRIKQIVIELQMRGFDGTIGVERINGQAMGLISFFNEDTLDVLFEKQIPKGTLAMFYSMGLIDNFFNDGLDLTFDQKSSILQSSFDVVTVITNDDLDEIAIDFVFASLSKYHPSTGHTIVLLRIAQFLLPELEIIFLYCLNSECGEILIGLLQEGVIETYDEFFPKVTISGKVFHDIIVNTTFDDGADIPLENWIVSVDGFLTSGEPIIGALNTRVSDETGHFAFTELQIPVTVDLIVVSTAKNGWIPSSPFGVERELDFTEKPLLQQVKLFPPLEFGQLRTPAILNVKVIVNEGGGDISPDNFTVNIINVDPTTTAPNGFRGSSDGTEVILDPGSYQVTILADSGIGPFTDSTSKDCSSRINGEEINPIGSDETRTCTITINDETPLPGKLIVIKKVINDEAGTLSSGDFTIQVTGNNPIPSEFTGVDGTPGTPDIPGSPESQVLFDDNFSSGLNGWVKYSKGNSPIAVPNPTDNYSLSVISTDGQSAPSAHISGDGYAIDAGMKKQITIPTDATQVILTFDGKAQGTLPSHEYIPNLLVSILDENNQNIYNEYVIGPGNPSSVSVTPWETYALDITDQVLGHSQVSIVLGLADSWSTNYSQKAWFDNVSVEVLSPGGSGTPGTPTTGGVEVLLQPGTFSVIENPPITYTVRYEGECSGTIASGEIKTCVVINEDRPEINPVVFEENFDDGNFDGWDRLFCTGGSCLTIFPTVTVAGLAPSAPFWGGIGVLDNSPSTNCNNFGGTQYRQTFDVVIPGDYNMKAHISLFHTNNVVTGLSMPGVSFSERGFSGGADHLRVIDETIHLNPGAYPIVLSMSFDGICAGTLTSIYDNISVTLVE